MLVEITEHSMKQNILRNGSSNGTEKNGGGGAKVRERRSQTC